MEEQIQDQIDALEEQLEATAKERDERNKQHREYTSMRIKGMSEAYLTVNGYRQVADACEVLKVEAFVDHSARLGLACDMSELYGQVLQRIEREEDYDKLCNLLDDYIDVEFCEKGWAPLVAVEQLLRMEMCSQIHKLLADIVEFNDSKNQELAEIQAKIDELVDGESE